MTLTTFLKELRALKGKYKVEGTGHIRARRKSTGYCPIVGVCKARTGRKEGYTNAATLLGLPPILRDRIIWAADSRNQTPTRKALLTALGLKELK